MPCVGILVSMMPATWTSALARMVWVAAIFSVTCRSTAASLSTSFGLRVCTFATAHVTVLTLAAPCPHDGTTMELARSGSRTGLLLGPRSMSEPDSGGRPAAAWPAAS